MNGHIQIKRHWVLVVGCGEMENWHFHVARDDGSDVYCSGSFSNRIPRNCFQFCVHPISIGKKSWNKNPNEEHIYRWIWNIVTNEPILQNGPNKFSNFACLVMITKFLVNTRLFSIKCGYLHFMTISGFSIGRIINQFQFYLFVIAFAFFAA